MQNKSINFLDLTIYADTKGNLKFKIFRKPTTTDLIIPFHSNHPINHKLAAFHSMAHRAFSIPMAKVDLDWEINTIFNISRANGYPTHMINKILEQHKNDGDKMVNNPSSVDNVSNNGPLQDTSSQGKSNFVSLTYFNRVSNQIGNIFHKYGYKAAFSTRSNCKNLICNTSVRNNDDKFDSAGVYRINCNSCPATYIGKTERSVRTRFSEHMRKSNSNVYKHISETGHSINRDSVTICRSSNNPRMLRTLENFEIRKSVLAKDVLLNVQTDLDLAGNILIDRCCALAA